MRINDLFHEWVLDVSGEVPVFCPYKSETGEVVFGLNYMSNKCPGELVGIVHADGQDAVEKWIEENPNWKKKYGGKHDRKNGVG